MIFFIAAVVVSIAIVGVLFGATYKFTDSIERRADDLSDELGTSISILNDEKAMPYNASNNTLFVYVKNTGSTILTMTNKSVLVLINGTAYSNLTFWIVGGGTDWAPDTVATILIGDISLPADDHTLKVYVKKGASDTLEFTIT
jgi:flagellar protein FlaG